MASWLVAKLPGGDMTGNPLTRFIQSRARHLVTRASCSHARVDSLMPRIHRADE